MMKIEMGLTKRELEIIRSALCRKSMNELCHAIRVQEECKEKGIEDTTSSIYYNALEEIWAIIDRIDQLER